MQRALFPMELPAGPHGGSGPSGTSRQAGSARDEPPMPAPTPQVKAGALPAPRTPAPRTPGSRTPGSQPARDVAGAVPARDVVRALTRCTASHLPFQWTLNPYRGCEFACGYCYARYTHAYLGLPDERLDDPRDFERRIFVKHDVARLFARDLDRRVRPGDVIAMGTATDPYQPLERRHALVRACLRVAVRRSGATRNGMTRSVASRSVASRSVASRSVESRSVESRSVESRSVAPRSVVSRSVASRSVESGGGASGNATPPFTLSITTKSDLVLRDLDLLRVLASRGMVHVNISITTMDRALARTLEPRAPAPERRIRAVETLAAEGIPVGVFLMPVLPGLTDGAPPDPTGFETVIDRAAAAGASWLAHQVVFLREPTRSYWFGVLRERFPALVEPYHRLFAGGAHAADDVRAAIADRVDRARIRHGLAARPTSGRPADPQMRLAFVDDVGESDATACA